VAVEKVYKCDLCGTAAQRGELAVARVGTADDRPEDAQRVDIGPCCHQRPVSDMLATARDLAGA
jgi:hypothetical protein